MLSSAIVPLQKHLYTLQTFVEEKWPFPGANTNFNLSFRDLFVTVLLVTVFSFLSSKTSRTVALSLALVATIIEPAIAVFPANVLSSLMLRTPRFWNPLVVEPRLKYLLTYFDSIRAETLEVLHREHMPLFHEASPQQTRISGGQPWRVYPLFSYGSVNEDHCKRMPTLYGVVSQIQSIKLAMLSVMEGGAEIPLHCGYFKGVLRVHLTLYTEQDDTESRRFIEVGGQRYSWKEKELVAFDDTYPHRVVNHVPGKRVVLFLDVERPVQTSVFKTLQSLYLKLASSSPSVQQLAKQQEKIQN